MSDDVRARLCALARSRRTRHLGWPRDWSPGSIRVPKSLDPCDVFTDDGAWQFIADRLEEGCEIEEITMEEADGAGRRGYVLRLTGTVGEPEIYVKLQIGRSVVVGRSFHYSYARRS